MSKLPRSLWFPLVLAGLAALLGALAPLFPVTEPAEPRGFNSAPMLIVFAVAPFLLASVLAVRGDGRAAARALGAVALFAPGRALTDLQLSKDLSRSTRPELVLPTSLAPPGAASGLWLLLAAHLLTALAGLLAFVLLRARDDADATDVDRAATAALGQRPGTDPVPATVTRGQGRTAIALSIGMLAGIALLLSEPFESDNVYLLAGSVLEAPALVFAGGLLLVAAVPVAAVFAVGAERAGERRGGLFGMALVLLAVAVPQLVSGLAVGGLHPTWGPVLVVTAAVAFILLGWPSGGSADTTSADRPDGGEPAELRLPGLHRLQVTAGVFGLLAAVASITAGTSRQVVLPEGLPPLVSYADRLLVPAGILVGVLSLMLLAGSAGRTSGTTRPAAAARPAFVVSLAAVPLAATEALDGALTAADVDGVRVAAGPWLAVLGILFALLAAGFAAVAGSVEREDVDLSEPAVRPLALGVVLVAVLLVVGAFALPVLRAPDYSAPALSTEAGVAWWGPGMALVTIVLATLLAPFSRPARAAALLLGAAGVLAVHLLELPLTRDRVQDSEAGPGLWFSVAGLLALLVAAALTAAPGAVRLGSASRSAGDRA